MEIEAMPIALKEAVTIAIENIADLFSSQNISGVLLEEVDRDAQANFLITVGFERPLTRRSGNTVIAGITSALGTQRAYKVACIDKENGELMWVKDRILDKQ